MVSRHRRQELSGLLIFALLLAGCDGSTAPSSSVLIVRPAFPSLFAGDTLHVRAMVVTADGDTVAPAGPVSWSLQGPAVQLNAGFITGVAPGTATITARAGSESAEAEVVVLSSAPRAAREIGWVKWVSTFAVDYRELQIRLHDPVLDVDRDLIPPAFGMTELAWAPDGSGVAAMFSSDLGATPDRFGLWYIPVNGKQRRIAFGGGQFAWSPDSRSLVVTSPALGGISAIFLVGIGPGMAPRQLTFTASALWPSWSPDGRRIAYRRGTHELWTMRADGSDQQLLYAATNAVGSVQWSPDGRLIAFVEAGGVRVIDSDGRNYRTASGNCDSAGSCSFQDSPKTRLHWSRDGRKLVYGLSLEIADVGHYEIVDVRAGTRDRLSYDGCHETLGFSPDGARIGIACLHSLNPSRWLAVDEQGTVLESHRYDWGVFFSWRP